MVLGRRVEFEIGLAQLMELAETTGNAGLLAMAHTGGAVLALLDGRFADVSTNADRILEAAPDAQNFRFAYLALLRRVAIEGGRLAELLPVLEALNTDPELHVMHAELGRVRLDTGDHAGAAETLDHLISHWNVWSRDWTWPLTLVETAEVVAGLKATRYAELLVAELEPYTGELVFVGAGVFCSGAFDRYRGMLLSLLGHQDEAVAALAAGLALEESVESPPLTARSRYWFARALLERDEPGDRDRATVELGRSIGTAEQLGMAGLAVAGRELAEAT
jgi:hypothetical protein